MSFEENIANMGHTYLISLPVSRNYHSDTRGTVSEIFQSCERVYLLVYAANILEEETVPVASNRTSVSD